ncbi:MAG: ribonuclease P protein component [Clostridia bacterium]|nr:ribonuclease P protein component [Clostridia bacterium]
MKHMAIRENHLYQKAYKNGKRFVGRYTAVYVLRDYAAPRLKKEHPQKLFVNRLGLSVSKKIGGAVERNRAKRIIRAAYDTLCHDLKTGFLIVISARGAIEGRTSTEVARELNTAFTQLGLLVPQRTASPSQKEEHTL